MGLLNDKKGTILRSIILIVGGFTLLLYPEMATNTLAYIISLVFVVMGVVNIVGYFRKA